MACLMICLYPLSNFNFKFKGNDVKMYYLENMNELRTYKSRFHGKYILGTLILKSYTKIIILCILPKLPSMATYPPSFTICLPSRSQPSPIPLLFMLFGEKCF